MGFSIQHSFAGSPRTAAENQHVAESQKPGEKVARQRPNPQLITTARVERVEDSEEALELQAVTHTIHPSANVQTFLSVARNGRDYHAVDLYV